MDLGHRATTVKFPIRERSGGPDLEREARVAQAPAEQLPAAVFGDEPGQLGPWQGRDGDLAGQAAGAGPGGEVPQQVALLGDAMEPVVDGGLGGGAQGGAAVIEPGQERQGDQDAAAGPPRGGHGEAAAAAGPAGGEVFPGTPGGTRRLSVAIPRARLRRRPRREGRVAPPVKFRFDRWAAGVRLPDGSLEPP
jgi:hypothetical protein